MNVAVIGGTGFVGEHLVNALLAAGHQVALLVRPGSEAKIAAADRCRIVSGDLSSFAAIAKTLVAADAVIYNVGILREFPRRGITFEGSQHQGVVDTINAAKQTGTRRMLLMSANGVRSPGTPYQETKYRAEQALKASGLDYTIFRPSVIFGDPGTKMEIATQLYQQMIRPPLPAVAFHTGLKPAAGPVVMSPVHVADVVDAFVKALNDPVTVGQSYDIGGPEALSWAEMLRRIAAAAGKKKIILPMPISLMKFGATLFDWLPFFPATRDQLTMLAEGNTADPAILAKLLDREPTAFDAESLAYLSR